MKKIEFKTSKGRFIILDVDYNSMIFVRILGTATACLGSEELFDYKEYFKLSEISEKEASEIVDSTKKSIQEKHIVFQDYQSKYKRDFSYYTAIESLQSLLKSKGIHLFENPVPKPEYQFDNFGNGGMCESWIDAYKEQEQKTFYNPYIFKL